MSGRPFIFVLLFFISVQSVIASESKIPHELQGFYEKLIERFKSLEHGLVNSNQEVSLATRFLNSLVTHFKQHELGKSKELKTLDTLPELKAKLLSLKKKTASQETKSIDIELLSEILKDSMSKLSEKEKIQLSSLLLTEMEKQTSGAKETTEAMESLIAKYQKDPLLEETKKSEKKGIELLSEIVSIGLANPESIGSLFSPIKEAIFDSEKATLPSTIQANVPSFAEVSSFLETLSSQPFSPPSPNGMALNPYLGGNFAGSKFGSAGQFRSPRLNLGSQSPTPLANDTTDLKACTDEIKKKRFNVELHLPGALCASTAISKSPEQTMKSFRSNGKGQCQVDLASALHCVEGKQGLLGNTIQANIGNLSTPSKVIGVGSVDNLTGRSIQGGNADFIILTVEVPCEAALRLQVARIPSPQEIAELARGESIPIVMQQNSTINASQQGINQATIAATGSFDRREDGTLGNFIRFNSNSRFNRTSGLDVGPRPSSSSLAFDSNRIKSGDSGGAALTCKFGSAKNIEDILYMGAISHIDVRGDQDEGKEGGIASGQSLLNLSHRVWGNPEFADGKRFADQTRAKSSHPQSVLTH